VDSAVIPSDAPSRRREHEWESPQSVSWRLANVSDAEWMVEQSRIPLTFDLDRDFLMDGTRLYDKNAVIGLSKMNPLPRDSAVNKSLSKKPKPPPSGVTLNGLNCQAVEACSTGQAPTVQTGTACEDRDAKAEAYSEGDAWDRDSQYSLNNENASLRAETSFFA